MSGPKVFHVVTREELVARCEAALRRLDAAIAEWTSACARCGNDEAATEMVTARRQALQRMLQEDRFAEIQRQVPAEISFLQADAQSRQERAAAAAAQAILYRRRAARTAQLLLDALKSKGYEIPADLQRDLSSSEPADAAITRAFELLSPPTQSERATERQRELARELGQGERRIALAEWLATQPTSADRDADLRIDRHLAELSTLGIDASPYVARVVAIPKADPVRQALLADSLLVELSNAVKEGRQKLSRLADLKQRSAELARYYSADARVLQDRLDAAITAQDAAAAPALLAESEALIEQELRALAANARRHAVLKGLASLGYEVHEGMATAWVQAGQIVLRKAANPDYGIELGGGIRSDRLQVRAVAFGSTQTPRDVARDRDAEASWCNEFEQLRGLVSAAGGGIEIEHALAVGATPLKLVDDSAGRDHSDEVMSPRTFRR
jgi:hypothetical protein